MSAYRNKKTVFLQECNIRNPAKSELGRNESPGNVVLFVITILELTTISIPVIRLHSHLINNRLSTFATLLVHF